MTLRSSLTKPSAGDVIAGISVALVVIPQSVAYAEIAALPPRVGLLAAGLPSLLAAPFVSSPYLQTGPVALTSLLTLGALQGIDGTSAEIVRAAALLAFIVGIVRLFLGIARLGAITKLLSDPVVLGFTTGAAILIVSSQLNSVFGTMPEGDTTLSRAGWTLTHPGEWRLDALAVSAMCAVVIFGGRRVHRLFPGVLVAVVLALVWSVALGYDGPLVGDVPGGLFALELDVEWNRTGSLVAAGIIIALVGFAEPASIAMTQMREAGLPWSANRELIGQGVANLAAGVAGGYPVGGSFSRSSLNKFAGATTAWSGAITGAFVIAALPLTPLLEELPRAALGAIVITAVARLIDLTGVARLVSKSPIDGSVALITLGATLITAPRIERGVVIGIVVALLVSGVRRLRRDHMSGGGDGASRFPP